MNTDTDNVNPEPVVASQVMQKPAQEPAFTIASFLSLSLVASFWMPWFNLLGLKATGISFSQQGNENRLLWLIPFMGVVTVLLGFTSVRQRAWAQITGALPILIILYFMESGGARLTMELLDVGAYVAIGTGALMIISPYIRLARPHPHSQ